MPLSLGFRTPKSSCKSSLPRLSDIIAGESPKIKYAFLSHFLSFLQSLRGGREGCLFMLASEVVQPYCNGTAAAAAAAVSESTNRAKRGPIFDEPDSEDGTRSDPERGSRRLLSDHNHLISKNALGNMLPKKGVVLSDKSATLCRVACRAAFRVAHRRGRSLPAGAKKRA